MSEEFNLPMHYCHSDGIHDDDGAFFQCFEDTSMDKAAAHAINCHDDLVDKLTAAILCLESPEAACTASLFHMKEALKKAKL